MDNTTRQDQACDLDFEEMEHVAGGTGSGELICCNCGKKITGQYTVSLLQVWCQECFLAKILTPKDLD